METSKTTVTDIEGRNNNLLRAQLIGVNDFNLRVNQVASSSFNEETLANIIRLRVQGKAASNQEAFQMMEGLKSLQIKEMVNKDLTREQVLNLSNDSLKIPKPEKSFIPTRILKGDWRIPDYQEPSLLAVGRSLDSLTKAMPVAKSDVGLTPKSKSEASLTRTRSKADLNNNSKSPETKRKRPSRTFN